MSDVPEYTVAAATVLLLASAVAWRRGVLAERAAWATLGIFAVLTVAADLVLTGVPIVTYARAQRSGVGFGPMPVEDLAYGLALCLVAMVAWRRGHDDAKTGSAAR